MNPQDVTTALQKALTQYMEQYRPVGKHDPRLKEELKRYFQSPDGRFVSDYYVENIPYYKADDKTTLASLAAAAPGAKEGLILQETADLFTAYFSPESTELHPEDIRLYEHQASAVKAVNEGHRNLLVCTGTGSGKTESFLIPLIDAIMREHRDKGTDYKKGVRAMILYPMNALVSDQLLRIRKIFMEAERRQIPYANEITFGIYTGEVATLNQEKPRLELTPQSDDLAAAADATIEAQKAADAVECGEAPGQPCAHPYLSANDVPHNEHTRRSDWLDENKGPADILITNYAMLERLLLDPQQSNLFSETWKFIVLDEAHTYIGAQGTEISWLLRRLRNRLVSQDGKKAELTYLATSATLVDAKSKEELSDKSEAFAQSLFHTDTPFSVQGGTPFAPAWPRPESECYKDGDYAALLGAPPLADFMPTNSLLPHGAPADTLFEQTRSYLELCSWHKGFKGKEKLLHADCALGDALTLGKVVLDLGTEKDFKLTFDEFPVAIRELAKLLSPDEQRKERHKILRMCTDSRNQQEWSDAKTFFENVTEWNSDMGSFIIDNSKSDRITQLGMLLMQTASMVNVSDEGGSPYDLSPLTWRVRVNADCLKVMKEALDKLQSMEADLENMGKKLLGQWGLLLFHAPATGQDSISRLITRYLLQRAHLGKLDTYFKEHQDSPAQWTSAAISKHLFGGSPKAVEEFDALTRLITLSEHPDLKGKPLLNLRYHQVVNAPSSVYVWFSKDKDTGEVQVHVPELRDPESSVYEDETGRHHLYRLGICYDCGHPYILGYYGSKDGERRLDISNHGCDLEKKVLNRYKTSRSYYLHAFTWTTGCHQTETEDDKEGENDTPGAPCWLEYDKGIIHCAESVDDLPGDPSAYIRMAFYAYTKAPDVNINNADTPQRDSSQRIISCPACGAISRRPEDWGMIGTYSLDANSARFTALDTLVQQADPTVRSHQSPSLGRKVLTFSDTRAGAAAIATRYEQFTERNLVLDLLKAAFRHVQDNPEVDMVELYRMQGNDEVVDSLIRHPEDQPAKREKYHNTLMLILPTLVESLKAAGAYHLLNKETVDLDSFSELDSAALTALKVLRTTGSRWNDIFADLNIYSHARSQSSRPDDWKNIRECFKSDKAEELAQEYFNKAYLYLFLSSKLAFPNDYSKNYEKDSQESLDGYSRGYKRYIVKESRKNGKNAAFAFISNEKGKLQVLLKELKAKHGNDIFADRDKKKIVGRLFEYMKATGILIAQEDKYRLNFGDVRFEFKGKQEGVEPAAPAVPGHPAVSYRAEEHTAQLSKEVAQLYQRLFSCGDINILSSSTTFEMGVDLGDLNCVMLCNMPPYVANYKQRAGRAGRRAGASAYVLTFIGDAAHDAYYRNNPHELFFGKVVPPRIYENKSFRAKHLRAVALHNFLKFLDEYNHQPGRNEEDKREWRTCGRFFCGELEGYPTGGGQRESGTLPRAVCDRKSAVSLLPDWASKCGEELQQQCNAIVNEKPAPHQESNEGQRGEVIKQKELDYSVALDLCVQLIGLQDLHALPGTAAETPSPNTKAEFYVGTRPGLPDFSCKHFYRELSGPFLPEGADGEERNMWQSSLLRRYEPNHNNLHREHCRDRERVYVPFMRYRQHDTIMHLAHTRVLPTYGFPCDIVYLQTEDEDVELDRDLRLAIFDYAPGRHIDANKKVFTSERPIQFLRSDGERKDLTALGDHTFLHCPICNMYARDFEEMPCPHCHSLRTRLYAAQPQGFMAGKSRPARWSTSNPRINRYIGYLGNIDEAHSWSIKGSGLKGYASDERSMLYLNDLREGVNLYPHEVDVKGRNKGFDALFHIVHTDIVIWTQQAELTDAATRAWGCAADQVPMTRIHNAWRSAVQAIVKAVSIELGMLNREIGGMYYPIRKNHRTTPYIVLYDNSQGGSGAVLQLLQTEQGEEDCNRKTIAILRRALALVEECDCCKKLGDEGQKPPHPREEYLSNPEGKREYRGCYRCVKSYENQREHEILDAYDAAVILRHLLGQGGGGAEGQQHSESATVIPKAQASTTAAGQQDRGAQGKPAIPVAARTGATPPKQACAAPVAGNTALLIKLIEYKVLPGTSLTLRREGADCPATLEGYLTQSRVRCRLEDGSACDVKIDDIISIN